MPSFRRAGHRRSRRAWLHATVLVLLSGWGLWSAWHEAAPWVAVRLGPIDTVRWGELATRLPGRLWVLRVERLLVAPVEGRAVPLVAEGEAVRRGQGLVRITPTGSASATVLSAPFAGVASFVFDGHEGDWQGPGDPLPPTASSGATARSVAFDLSKPVARGQPVVRVVDRTGLYAAFWAETPGQPSGVRVGQRSELSGPSAGPIPVQVVRAFQGAQGAMLLRLDRQPVEWLYRRRVDRVELVTERRAGVVLPASAMVERGGEPGVWVATDGGPVFMPVRVVARQGSYVAILGIPAGSRVYRWPRWIAGP